MHTLPGRPFSRARACQLLGRQAVLGKPAVLTPRPPRPGEPALPGSREPVLWAQAPRRRYPLCVPVPRGADSHSEAGCWVCCVQTAGAGKAETVPEE